MDLVVIKEKNKIKVIKDGIKINTKKDFCFINGKIYNLNDIEKLSFKSDEEKVLYLYDKYGNKLFNKLNCDASIIIIKDGKIVLSRDRMGSRHWYYTKINETFICSTSLKYIIDNYKDILQIDKQILANYLAYCYINEPDTIFKNVYKLKTGNYLIYDNKISCYRYYDLIEEYKKYNNTIKKYKVAKEQLKNNLIDSVNKKTNGFDKVGIFFSSGVDSTLLASIATNLNKEVHTYTIGFIEEERDESKSAYKMSQYLNTIHHEYILKHDIAKEIVNDIFKIYTEPFADPSILPIILLNKKIDKDIGVVITGDAADQLFVGSAIYDFFSLRRTISRFIRRIPTPSPYNRYFQSALMFNKVPSKSYLEKYNINVKQQIRYMLYDIKNFLANRLFTKVSIPAQYYDYNIVYPFTDNNVLKTSLKIKHSFKFYKRNKKYILKEILYDYINRNDFNASKSGFGIPLNKWLKNLFLDDIIKYSNEEALKKQGLFDYELINNEIGRLKNDEITIGECYVMFSYYMFQLWYKEYIDNLWL